MQFSFRDAPGWFSEYVCAEFLDEFHTSACKLSAVQDALKDPRNHDGLLDFAVDFFDKKGFCVKKHERQLWFDLDETKPEYIWCMLKWS
jgi:hypothetical protein